MWGRWGNWGDYDPQGSREARPDGGELAGGGVVAAGQPHLVYAAARPIPAGLGGHAASQGGQYGTRTGGCGMKRYHICRNGQVEHGGGTYSLLSLHSLGEFFLLRFFSLL